MTPPENEKSEHSDQRGRGDEQSDQLPDEIEGPGELIADLDPRTDSARNSHAVVTNALLRQAERELEDEGEEDER